MKFLILNTDYPGFLHQLYAEHSGLAQWPYAEQMRVRNESLFGVADFYSRNLRVLGHEAQEIHANNEAMQRAWASEHGLAIDAAESPEPVARAFLQQVATLAARTPVRHLRPLFNPLLRSFDSSQPAWFYEILAAQIRHERPDVIINQDVAGISSRFLGELKPFSRLLIGQIASPIVWGTGLRVYDLMISSLPNFVERCQALGVPSELNRLAFEPAVLARLKHRDPVIDASFVGSLSLDHQSRIDLLEALCAQCLIEVWANGVDRLPHNSPIRSRWKGSVWGIEMYQTLHRSKMTVNHHIGISGDYANNMRLYEATGVGALLLVDCKKNLHDMFEPSREVVTYRSAEECVELIHYYQEHDSEREAIARAGQQRTLREHTYERRMRELLEIVDRHL
jgi:hypothetical protein